MRRIFLVAVFASVVTACLTTSEEVTDTTSDLGHGSGSSVRLTAVVEPTPRDLDLEYMVGASCMAVVALPGLGRRTRDVRSIRA